MCVCVCTQKYSEQLRPLIHHHNKHKILHLFMKRVYENKKERDGLDANIRDSFELPIRRDVLLGDAAIVTHHGEATLNIFHKLALKCSVSFPRMDRSVVKAKLISHTARLGICDAETRVKFGNVKVSFKSQHITFGSNYWVIGIYPPPPTTDILQSFWTVGQWMSLLCYL